MRPQLRKQGCEVELLGVNDGTIRLRVETGSHTCGSTGKTVQATLEGAIYDAAPDLASLVIEGFEEKPASGFVALDKLMGSRLPANDCSAAAGDVDGFCSGDVGHGRMPALQVKHGNYES